MPVRHQFKRAERLKSRTIIRRLFNREGHSTAAFPLRLIWLEVPLDGTGPAQFAVSVPKRSIPKAAHRNRIRRQIREAYRLNKYRLYEFINDRGRQYALILLYTAKKPVTYHTIEEKLNILIERFIRESDK